MNVALAPIRGEVACAAGAVRYERRTDDATENSAQDSRAAKRQRHAFFQRKHVATALKATAVGCDIAAAVSSHFSADAKPSGLLWTATGLSNGIYHIVFGPPCDIAGGMRLLSDAATAGAGATSASVAFLSGKPDTLQAVVKSLSLGSYGLWIVAGTLSGLAAIYVHFDGRVLTLVGKDRVHMLAVASLTASGLFHVVAGLLGLLNVALFDGNQGVLRDLTVACWLAGAILEGLAALLGEAALLDRGEVQRESRRPITASENSTTVIRAV